MARLLGRAPSVEIAPLEDEAVLFSPENNKFYVLNKTSAFLWDELEHSRTADQLAKLVAESFSGVTEGDALSGVTAVLEQMESLQLVVEVE